MRIVWQSFRCQQVYSYHRIPSMATHGINKPSPYNFQHSSRRIHHLNLSLYSKTPPNMTKEHSGRKSRARRKRRRRRRVEAQRLAAERNRNALHQPQKDYGSEGSDSSHPTVKSSDSGSDATSDSDAELVDKPGGSDPERASAPGRRTAETKEDAP